MRIAGIDPMSGPRGLASGGILDPERRRQKMNPAARGAQGNASTRVLYMALEFIEDCLSQLSGGPGSAAVLLQPLNRPSK
jgi:hypothetical protein